jgi:two-component system chemotaxis sensor kinase CheA
VELKDRVEQILATIGELRQTAADGRKSRQLVDSLFRTVHSFKAAASAAGRNDVSRLAHEFENLLYSLRTGKLVLDDEVLRVCDDTAIALLGESQTFSLDSFHKLTSHKTQSQPLLPAEFTALKDDERHRAVAALQEGSNLYVMEVLFELSDFDIQFRELTTKLGEVISTQARAEGDQADKIRFRIVYAAKSELIRVHTIFEQVVHAGLAAAAKLDKQVSFIVRGDELLLDKSMSDALADALLHLVRNAVDHGIESHGTIVLEATTVSGQTLITVTDDGRGIEPGNIPLIFQPGFSTATGITDLSGRGVGLDVVATTIQELGGTITVTSEPGQGASFEIKLPLRLSV